MEGGARGYKRKQEDDLTFSYDIVDYFQAVMEKGSEKSKPEKQYEISFDIIKSALFYMRTENTIRKTPCEQHPLLNGFNIILKKELYQLMESVKARGVIYTLQQLPEKQKRNGVIAISTGGFAYSLCYFGKKFNIPVTLVMPESTENEVKNICRNLGANVFDQNIQNITQAHTRALTMARLRGLAYLDKDNHPNMIIGQSTLGLEIWEDVQDADVIILPSVIWGCGFTFALTMAIKGCNPNITIIVVKTTTDPITRDIRERTNLFNELEIPVTKYSLYKAGRNRAIDSYIYLDYASISNSWQILLNTSSDLFLTQCNNDPSAMISFGAILSGKLDDLKGKRVVIPVYGQMEWFGQQNALSLETRLTISSIEQTSS